jgi:hypothetical protein
MRRIPQAGLGITALIVLTLVLPSRGAAQTAASPWTAATATDTSGKKKQTIELDSWQFGASNPSSLGAQGQGGKEGKVSTSEITVGGGTPVTPVYKAPGIIVPPSGGTPNDSAHHHPKH